MSNGRFTDLSETLRAAHRIFRTAWTIIKHVWYFGLTMGTIMSGLLEPELARQGQRSMFTPYTWQVPLAVTSTFQPKDALCAVARATLVSPRKAQTRAALIFIFLFRHVWRQSGWLRKVAHRQLLLAPWSPKLSCHVWCAILSKSCSCEHVWD